MQDLRRRVEIAQDRLRSGAFSNEASTSTGVVLPILDALGWDAFDPNEVAPEYKVKNRRVDFALVSNGSPSVFVEVKQPGLASGADQQLFEYAFHEGVPLAVLTDGSTWSVYVPSEQGSYEDRRAYHLDLAERDPEESADRLRRYLDRAAVASGEAVRRARQDCQSAKQRKGARAATPQAWANLVAAEDAAVLDRLATEVESASGYQPEKKDLIAFLSPLAPATGRLPEPKKPRAKPTSASAPAIPTSPSELGEPLPGRGFALGDAFVPARSGADLLAGVFRALAAADPTFLDRFAGRYQGRKRRYIARNLEDLFPGRPEFHGAAREVGQGYWISTQNSTAGKRSLIKSAADVAGLEVGGGLRVRFEKVARSAEPLAEALRQRGGYCVRSGMAPPSSEITTSTRRFCWRPAALALEATGKASP